MADERSSILGDNRRNFMKIGTDYLTNFARSFVTGGLAAMSARTAALPIVNYYASSQAQHRYMAYWTINFLNISQAIPIEGFNFAFNDHYQKWLFRDHDQENQLKNRPWQFFFESLAAGGVAGATAIFSLYPLYSAYGAGFSAIDIGENLASKTSNAGFTANFYGWYRGFLPSLTCAVVYRAGYFGFYDTLKAIYAEKMRKKPAPNFFESWAIAQVTTLGASFLAYPFDVVRHRVSIDYGRVSSINETLSDEKKRPYPSSLRCAAKIWRKEGVSGFYKGIAANAFRTIGAAFTLPLYDLIKVYM